MMAAAKRVAINPDRWKAAAKKLLPDVYDAVFELSRSNPYQGTVMEFFFELLPRTQSAHRAGDEVFLANAYGFAEWCLAQPERELWNAAGVAFYADIFKGVPVAAPLPWIDNRVWNQVESLLEWHLQDKFESVKELRRTRSAERSDQRIHRSIEVAKQSLWEIDR